MWEGREGQLGASGQWARLGWTRKFKTWSIDRTEWNKKKCWLEKKCWIEGLRIGSSGWVGEWASGSVGGSGRSASRRASQWGDLVLALLLYYWDRYNYWCLPGRWDCRALFWNANLFICFFPLYASRRVCILLSTKIQASNYRANHFFYNTPFFSFFTFFLLCFVSF